jgi:hypothetical protein
MALAGVPREERLGRLLQARKFRDALDLLAQDPDYDVNFTKDDLDTPLYYVSARSRDPDAIAVADALLARDTIDVNRTKEQNGLTPLISAIDDVHWPFVRKLLARGDIRVNHVFVERDGSRTTALDRAETERDRATTPAETADAEGVITALLEKDAKRAAELAQEDVSEAGIGQVPATRTTNEGEEDPQQGGRKPRRKTRKTRARKTKKRKTRKTRK